MMKKYLFLMAIAIMCSNIAAQTPVKKDSTGVYVSKSVSKIPDKKTGATYRDSKGNLYPIYVSSNGKYYIIRKSAKTGNEYKYYLKIED